MVDGIENNGRSKIIISIVVVIIAGIITGSVLFFVDNTKITTDIPTKTDTLTATDISITNNTPTTTSTPVDTFQLKNIQWITADPHTHMKYCAEEHTPQEMVANMKKNNINVTSVLLWSQGLSDPVERRLITGKDHPASIPGHILHADVEISQVAATHMGHLILLGLQSLGFSDNPGMYPHSGVPIVEWAAKQNPPVVVGSAHGQWALRGENFKSSGPDVPLDFPIHVARGHVQFLELDQWSGVSSGDNSNKGEDRSILTHVLSKLLNSGYKVTLTGGSDFNCLSAQIGDVRTYALIKNSFSYSSFLEAIKNGRTVITNHPGDWMNIKINGHELGSETKIKAGESVRLEIESNLQYDNEIEIIANGKILKTIEVGSGKQTTKLNLALDSSTWIMGRTKFVLTSPTYVIVDGKPIRASTKDACYLVRYVDYLIDRVETDSIDLGKDKKATLVAYAEARKEFMKRFKEAGGVECT